MLEPAVPLKAKVILAPESIFAKLPSLNSMLTIFRSVPKPIPPVKRADIDVAELIVAEEEANVSETLTATIVSPPVGKSVPVRFRV